MSSESIQAAALALRQSRATRKTIAPISATHGIAGLEAAYAVAELNTQARLAEGRRVVGLKVGLTSKAVQLQLGVDQPDFGVLFDDMECLNGQDAPVSGLMQTKVEAEVAFVVGRDLPGQQPSWGEFLGCLVHALPALEIVDSAITDWKISLVDTVAGPAVAGRDRHGDEEERPDGVDGHRRCLPGPPAARRLLAGSHHGRAWPGPDGRTGHPVGCVGAHGAGEGG